MRIREVWWTTDWKRGLADCFEAFGPVELSRDTFWRVADKRECSIIHTFVAIENDTVIGTATAVLIPKFTHGGRPAAQIEDVATHPNHRGKGVATALLKHIIAFCKEQGAYKVILNCAKHLVPFYEQFGFVQHEVEMRLDFSYEDEPGGVQPNSKGR